MPYPIGTTYYITDQPLPRSGVPTVYRLVSDGLNLLGEDVFTPPRGGWVSTSEISRMRLGDSDDDWIVIDADTALSYVAAKQRWWEAQQHEPS